MGGKADAPHAEVPKGNPLLQHLGPALLQKSQGLLTIAHQDFLDKKLISLAQFRLFPGFPGNGLMKHRVTVPL